MNQKNIVQLKKKERHQLEKIVGSGTHNARQLARCRILLLADKNTKKKSDTQIVEALGVCLATVHNVRRRFFQEGISSIQDKPRSGQPPKFKGKPAAGITALACSAPPDGRTRWTLELLADRAVELKLVDSICPQSVLNILKKTKSNPISRSSGASGK